VLNKEIIGFSCFVLTENPKELKLDKLYLHPHHQRKGYGAILVEDVKQFMPNRGLEQLILTVNKNNTSAIAAYQRYGFTISDDIIIDIGNGFVMDDYLMTMTIK
jgi:ribosomal protein S18 acetylase RimI-like enzyme